MNEVAQIRYRFFCLRLRKTQDVLDVHRVFQQEAGGKRCAEDVPKMCRRINQRFLKFEVDPSILVGRGLAPAGEDPDKNLPCVKSVTSAKHDGGIVLSAGASPRPTTDHFALS